MTTRYDQIQAERRMREAKRRFSEACAAGLRGDPDSAKAAAAAHREVEACREELKRLAGLQLSDEWQENEAAAGC